MSRDDRLLFEDMVSSCRKIIRYAHGLTFEQFLADEKTFDAILRHLMVLGEAAKLVPTDVRERYPAIPWRRIAGLRDVAIHRYFGLDEEILWDVVEREVPALLPLVEAMLASS